MNDHNYYERAKRKLRIQGGSCAHPSCQSIANLSVDHIVPKLWFKMLGFDSFADADPDNFQILCAKHNTLKGNILDYTNPKTLPIIRKYINLWIEKHADYFVPIEKRVFKLGVRCICNKCTKPDESDEVVHKGEVVKVP